MNKDLILQLFAPETETLELLAPQTHELELTIPRNDGTTAKLIMATTAVWQTRVDYVPPRGTIIVYSDRNVIDGQEYVGLKIGDGLAYVVDLPFVGDEIADQIITDLNDHISDRTVHITQEEREYWNNKLNAELEGENLIISPISME